MQGYGLVTMTIRPEEPGNDRTQVLKLLQSVTEFDGRDPLSEHKYTAALGVGGQALVAVDGDEYVGFAALVPAKREGEWGIEIAVAPSARDTSTPVDLIRSAIDHIDSHGGTRTRVWSYASSQLGDETILSTLGFEAERKLLVMQRELPAGMSPDLPSGFVAAGFRRGQDEQAWLAVNNTAFAGHPENGAWTMDDLEERLSYRWVDTDGIRLIWHGDELAAFCWTKIHEDGRGEIYIIAVAEAFQGRGLGRKTVLEGMRYVEGQGAPGILLYTEGDNSAAIGLYESLGFTVRHTHRTFIRTDSR